MSTHLLLRAADYWSPAHWRWVLSTADGGFLADHEVRLDEADWQYEAWSDLLGHLAWHAAPDRRTEDEARIVAMLGEWVGASVLGPVGEAMFRNKPATIRVVVPAEPLGARSLLFRPLELARVGGRPIGLSRISLVYELAPATGNGAPPGQALERVRVLGLFSLPEGSQPLNLRRERQALLQTSAKIAALGQPADVRVLQYGVTRDRLRDVLQEAEGWDAIHVSGQGAPGELLLETAAGRPDRVTGPELARMLEPTRDRVKLVTASASWSAAYSGSEQRLLLGLPAPAGWASGQVPADEAPLRDRTSAADGPGDGVGPGPLAIDLADRLGCAVLAMRYPVTDDFATAFFSGLYERLLGRGQPLPEALGFILHEIAPAAPTTAIPAVSLFSPMLVGSAATTVLLRAPRQSGAYSFDTRVLKMAGFPPQPDRFVGRTAVMARASAVLAEESRVPGVLLHGMPGAGKTACALELAYTHEHAFAQLIWFKAPDAGQDIRGALAEFALTLERELPGFRMVHVLEDRTRLAGFLPQLADLAERQRLLIIIDNIESLLTDDGQWRDAAWGQVVAALCAHEGLGRVVLTSRRMPVGSTRLRAEAVDALSLDEALLLARELPHLRALIEGDLPGVDRDVARSLALGVLNVAQGHPKLLELADGQVSDPTRLATLVEAGDQAWRQAGELPEGFFATGEPWAAAPDYLRVLGAWTRSVSGSLTAGQRTLFWFLCCLEEDDRVRLVVDPNWADLWSRLDLGGEPPDVGPALTALAGYGLIAVQAETDDAAESYSMNAGVAAAGRAEAGSEFQAAVDAELAAFWIAVVESALQREGDDPTTVLVVRGGLAAAPYLIRRSEWSQAASLLEGAFRRNPTRAIAAAVLPALRSITAAAQVPAAAVALGDVLELIDPAAAQSQMRATLDDAVTRGDYRSASVAAGRLAEQCRMSGRLSEALALTETKADYTRRSGLGPWTQLLDQVQRLEVLNQMGRAEQVLEEVPRLRARMQALPSVSDLPEVVPQWRVREMLLGLGRDVALRLDRWPDALDLNSELVASRQDRGAPVGQIARARFNDYWPLLQLGRTDDALAILRDCRRAFEEAQDIVGLGRTLGALAAVEDTRGHGEAAVSLAQDALRYGYLSADVSLIMDSHGRLGNYLRRHARRPDAALTHHLTAALIGVITVAGDTGQSVAVAAADLRALGAAAEVPGDVAELGRQVAAVPGADLGQLLSALTPDAGFAQQALDEVIARVRALSATAGPRLSRHLAAWDPVISALLAADDGEKEAAATLDAELASYAEMEDWSALAGALTRLRAGETGPDLLTGLDEIDTAIMIRALDARAGKIAIPASLWPGIEFGPALGDLVAATEGDHHAEDRARQVVQTISGDPDLAPLAAVLRRILDGDRAPGLAVSLTDPTAQAIVETVLQHAGSG